MMKKNDGFSLIEVVIAITILAILAMPILAYFTNAAVTASNGKGTQKANMAAQSVTEELNSCTSFEQIESKLVAVTGSAWTVDSMDDKSSELTKKITVDGTPYQAKVLLDYDYSRTKADGSETDSKYNEYASPKLKEVYSSNNVVMTETDQTETAAGNLLHTNQSATADSIKAGMTRTLFLEITKSSGAGGEIHSVKGYYVYTYGSDTYTAALKETKVEKLENVYVFYNLLRNDIVNEPVNINLTGYNNDEVKKLHFYFVCQKDSGTKPAGYSLNVTKNSFLPDANCHTELDSLIEKVLEKRIAKITVDIYHDTETVFTDSTRLVRLQTSKGA